MKMVRCPLFLLAAIAIFHVSAQGVAPRLPAAAREFLEAHNQARAAVGVRPLYWSQQLAKDTSLFVHYQKNKMACQFANITAGKYGANQHWAINEMVTPHMSVEVWVNKKQFYNHAHNSCVPNQNCDVYTQVVWRKSVALGCTQATCVKEGTSLTICFYDPPGNYPGESPY